MDEHPEWYFDQSQQATPPAHLIPEDFNPNQPGPSGLQQVGLVLPLIPASTENMAFPWLPTSASVAGPLGVPSIPTSLSYQHHIAPQNLVWTGPDPILQGFPPLLPPPVSSLDFPHLPANGPEPGIIPFLGTALQQAQFIEYLTQLKVLQDAQAQEMLEVKRPQSRDDELIDVTNMEDEDCVVVYDKQTDIPKPAFLTETEMFLEKTPFSGGLNYLINIMLTEKWKLTVKTILSATETFLGTGDGPAINARTTELVSSVLEIKNILLSSYIMDSIDIDSFSTPEVLLSSIRRLVKIVEHPSQLDNFDELLLQVSASMFAVILLLTDAMSLEPGIQEDPSTKVQQPSAQLNPIGLTVCARGLKEVVTTFRKWIEKDSPTRETELQNLAEVKKSIKNFSYLVVFTVLTYYQEAFVTNNRRLINIRDQKKGFAFFIVGRLVMSLLSGASSTFETITTSHPEELTDEDFLTLFGTANEVAFKALLSESELKLCDDTFDNNIKKQSVLQLLNQIKQDIWTNWKNTESLDKQMEQVNISEKPWTWRDELRKATNLRDEYKQLQPFEHGTVWRGPGIRTVIHHPELERTTTVKIVTSGVRRTESVVDIADLLNNRVSDGWIKTREVAAECAGFSKEEAEIEALTQLKKDAAKTRMQFYGTNIGKEATTTYAQKINKINKCNLEKLEDHNYSAKRPNVPVEYISPAFEKVNSPQEELRRKPSKLQRKLTLNRIPPVSSPEAIGQRPILTAHRQTSKEEIVEIGPVLYIEKEVRKPLSDKNYDNPVRYYHEQARLRSLKRYTDAVVSQESLPTRPNSQEVPTTKLSTMTIIGEDAENEQDAVNSDFERPTKSAKDNDSKKWYKFKKDDGSEKQTERKRKTIKERIKRKLHSTELEHEKRAGVYKKLVSKRNCFCHLRDNLKCGTNEKNTTSLRIHEVIARYSPLRLGEADPVANIHRPAREITAFFKETECNDVLYWEYRIREFGLRLVEFNTSTDTKKLRLWLMLYSFVNKDDYSVHNHCCVVEEYSVDYVLKLDQVINILFYASLNWNNSRINGHYGRALRSSVKAAEHFMGTCELSLWKDLPDLSKVATCFEEKPKMNPFTHRWVNWGSRREMLQGDYERKYYDQMRSFMTTKGLNPNNPVDQKKSDFWDAIKEYNSLHKAPVQNFKMLEIEPACQNPHLPKELIESSKDEDSGIDSDAATTISRVTIKALRKKYKKTRKRGHLDFAPPSLLGINDDNLDSNPQKKSKYTTFLDSGKKTCRHKRKPKVTLSTMLQFLRIMEPRLPQPVMDDITKCLILQIRIILMGYISLLPRNAHLTESAMNTIRQTIHDQITRNAFFMYRKAAQHRLSTGYFDGVTFFQPIESQNNYRHLYHPKFPKNFNTEDYDRMWFNDAIGNIASNVLLVSLSRKFEDWDRFTIALYHEKESTVLRAYIRELVEELGDIRKLFSGTNGYEILSFKAHGKSEYHGLYLNKCDSPMALAEPYIMGKVRSADEALSSFVNFPFNHTQLSTWYLHNVRTLGSDYDFLQNMSAEKLPSLDNLFQNLAGAQKTTKFEVNDLSTLMIAKPQATAFSDDLVVIKEIQESMIGRDLQMDQKWIARIDWKKYFVAYPNQTDASKTTYDVVEINTDSVKFISAVFESPNQTFYTVHEETPRKYKLLNRHRLRPEDDYQLTVSYIQKEAADWNELNREKVAALRKRLIEQRLERESRMEKFSQVRTTEVEALQSMETDATEPRGDIWDYGDGCPLVIDTESSHGSPMVEDMFSPPPNQKVVQGRFDDKHWNWMEQKRWKAERDEEDLIAGTIKMALNPPPYLFKKESVTSWRERLESEIRKKEQEDETNEDQQTLDEFAKYKAYSGMKNMSMTDAAEPMDQEATPETSLNINMDRSKQVPNAIIPSESEESAAQILEMEDFALKYGGKPPDGANVKIRFMGKLFTWEELERKILEVEAKQRFEENERKKKIAMRQAMIRKPETQKTPEAEKISENPTANQLSPVKTVLSQLVTSPIRGKFAPLVRRGSVRTNLRSDLQKPIPIIEAHTLRKPTRAGPRIIGPLRKLESTQSPKKTPPTAATPVPVQKIVPETTSTVPEVEAPSILTTIVTLPSVVVPTVDKTDDNALFKKPLLPAPKRRIRSASVPVKQPTRQELPVLRLRTPRTNLANPGPLRIKSFQSVSPKPPMATGLFSNGMKKSDSLPILRLRTPPVLTVTQNAPPEKSELLIELNKPPATLPSTPIHITNSKPNVQNVVKCNTNPMSQAIPHPAKFVPKTPAVRPLKSEKSASSPKKPAKLKKVPCLPIPICKPSTSSARCGPRSLRFWNEYIPDREIRKWLKSGEINPPASWELTRALVERSAKTKKFSKSSENVSVVDLTEHQEDTADVLAAVMDIESDEHLSQKVAEQAAIWASIEARKVEEMQEVEVLMHMEWETERTPCASAYSIPTTVERPQNSFEAHGSITHISLQKEITVATVLPTVPEVLCNPEVQLVTQQSVTPRTTIVVPQTCAVAAANLRELQASKQTPATPISEAITVSMSQQKSSHPHVKAETIKENVVAPTQTTIQPQEITALTVPEKTKAKTRKRGYEPDLVMHEIAPPTTPTQSEPYEFFYIGPDGLEYPIENIVAIQYHSDDENDYIPQIALLNSPRSRTPTTPTYMQPRSMETEARMSPYHNFESVVSPKATENMTVFENKKERNFPSGFEEISPVRKLNKFVESVATQKEKHTGTERKEVRESAKEFQSIAQLKHDMVHVDNTKENKLETSASEAQPEQEQLDRLSEGSLDDALLEFAASSELNIDDDADSLVESHSPEEKSPSPTNPWYNRLIKFLEDTGNESSPEGPDPPTVDESDFQKELLAAVQELSMKEPERCVHPPVSRTVQTLKDAENVRKSGSSSPISRRLRRRSAAQAAVVQRRNARRNLRGKNVPAGFVVPDQKATTSPTAPFGQLLQTSHAPVVRNVFTSPSFSNFLNFGINQQPISVISSSYNMQTPLPPIAVMSPQILNRTPPSPFVFPSYEFVSPPPRNSFYSPPSISAQTSYLPRYVIEPITPTYNLNEEELLRPTAPFDTHQDTLLDFDEEELLGPESYFDEQAAAQLQILFEPDETHTSTTQLLHLPDKAQKTTSETSQTTTSKNAKKNSVPVRKPRKSRLAFTLTAPSEADPTSSNVQSRNVETVEQQKTEFVNLKQEPMGVKPKRGRPPKKQVSQTDTSAREQRTAAAVETSSPDQTRTIVESSSPRKMMNKPVTGTIESNAEHQPESTVTEMIPETELVENQETTNLSSNEQQSSICKTTDPSDTADDPMVIEVIEREQSQSPVDFSMFHTSGLFGMQSAPKSKRRSTKRKSDAKPLSKNTTESPLADEILDSASDATSSKSTTRESVPDPFETNSEQVSVNSYGERVIVIDEDIQIVHCERANDENDLECTFEDNAFMERRKRDKERAAELDRELKQEAEDKINPPPPEPKEEEHFLALELDSLMFTLDYHFDEPDFYVFPPDCIQVDPELFTDLVDRVNGDDPNKIYEWVFSNYKPENRLSNYTDAIVERVLDNVPDGVVHVYNVIQYQIDELVMSVIHQFSVHACRVVQYKKGQLKFRSSVEIGSLIRFIAKHRVDFFKALTDHCGLPEKELHKQQGHWDHACLSVLHFCLDTLAKLGASSVACGGKATQNAIRLRFDAIVYGLYAFVQQGGLVRTYLAMAEEGTMSINRGVIFTCEVYLKNIDSLLRNIQEQFQTPVEERVEKSVENIVGSQELTILRDQARLIGQHFKDVPSCSKTKCLPFVFLSEQAVEIHKKVLHGRMEDHECTECQRDFRHKVSVLMHMMLTHHKKFFTEQEPPKQ